MRRILVRMSAAVLIVAMTYWFVANLVLLSPLGRAAMSSAHADVRYAWAYSLYPPHVVTRSPDLRVTTPNATLRVLASSARVSVSPETLLGIRTRTQSLVVANAEISIEHERAAGAHALARRAHVVPAGPAPASETTGREVRVDRLDVELRRVRTGALVIEGHGRLRARNLSLATPHDASLDHVRLELANGSVMVGERALARGVHGTVDMVQRTAPSVRGGLDGVAGTVRVVGQLVQGTGTARGSPIGGIELSISHADGYAQPGSFASARVEAAEVPLFDGVARGSAELRVDVADDGIARAQGTLRGGGWNRGEAELVRNVTVQFDAENRRLHLLRPLHGVRVDADASAVAIDPAGLPLFGRFVQQPGQWLDATGSLSVNDDEISGWLSGRTEELVVVLGDHRLVGPADVRVAVSKLDSKAKTAMLDARMQHRAASADTTLTLDGATIQLGTVRAIEGRAHVSLSSALPALDAITGRAALPFLLGSLAATQSLVGEATVIVTPGRVDARDIDAAAGPVHVRGRYTSSRRGGREGLLLMESGPFAIGVELEPNATTLVTADARRWFRDQVTDTNGSP